MRRPASSFDSPAVCIAARIILAIPIPADPAPSNRMRCPVTGLSMIWSAGEPLMLPHSRPADAAPFPPELPGYVLSLDLVRFGAGQDVADLLDQRAVITHGIGVPLGGATRHVALCAVVSMAVTAFQKKGRAGRRNVPAGQPSPISQPSCGRLSESGVKWRG
jgi:hypothetical protein